MVSRDISFSVKGLSCVRQQRRLFADISFQLQAGEMLLIQGSNGCGKSSLLRLLSGLTSPSGGEIIWQQESIQDCLVSYWQELHYLAHANGIKLGLTVFENLQLLSKASLSLNESRLALVLEALQLTPFIHTLSKQLSAGQKRRIALAKLMLYPKLLWLLDEPLTALDTQTQTLFLSWLTKHLQKGGIAVITSHHPISLCDVKTHHLNLA